VVCFAGDLRVQLPIIKRIKDSSILLPVAESIRLEGFGFIIHVKPDPPYDRKPALKI